MDMQLASTETVCSSAAADGALTVFRATSLESGIGSTEGRLTAGAVNSLAAHELP